MITILGNSLAGLTAHLLLANKNSQLVSLGKMPDTWNKPFILTSGAYQLLKKKGCTLKGFKIKKLEISALGQWGTLEFDDTDGIGFSVSSKDCLQALQKVTAPAKIINQADWAHLCEESQHIIVTDSTQIPDHTTKLCTPIHCLVYRCTLSQPQSMAFQRFIPDGLMAWIPENGKKGTCVVTSSQSLNNFNPDLLVSHWGNRLSLKEINRAHQIEIKPSLHQAHNPKISLLGRAQITIAPILARGFNLIIEQSMALSAGHLHQVDTLAQHCYQYTQLYQRLSDQKCGIGLGLASVAHQPILKHIIQQWGQQTNLLHNK